jgi:hypothetical protein
MSKSTQRASHLSARPRREEQPSVLRPWVVYRTISLRSQRPAAPPVAAAAAMGERGG